MTSLLGEQDRHGHLIGTNEVVQEVAADYAQATGTH